jgi:hypothetical protein
MTSKTDTGILRCAQNDKPGGGRGSAALPGEKKISGECRQCSGCLRGKDARGRHRVPPKAGDYEEQDNGQLRGHEELKDAGKGSAAGRRGNAEDCGMANHHR